MIDIAGLTDTLLNGPTNTSSVIAAFSTFGLGSTMNFKAQKSKVDKSKWEFTTPDPKSTADQFGQIWTVAS